MTRADDPVFTEYTGMKKRELFAAMAMQGLTSHVVTYDSVAPEWIASEAVRRADALIEALNEQKEKP